MRSVSKKLILTLGFLAVFIAQYVLTITAWYGAYQASIKIPENSDLFWNLAQAIQVYYIVFLGMGLFYLCRILGIDKLIYERIRRNN